MSDLDVLVVGGGPAGAATAIVCAAAGLRVVVAERQRFPRPAPGETLHPGVEALLDRLGVGDAVRGAGFLRHTGHWVCQGNARWFVPFGQDANGPWQGFQAERAVFDAILLARAQSAGADVWQRCPIRHPLVRAGRVVGAMSACGALNARFVVDASGPRGWLARSLRLPVHRVGPRRIAWYGYAVGSCPLRDVAPTLMAEAEGWMWTARVRPGCYHWTRLTVPGWRPPTGWLPDEYRELVPLGSARGADVSWRAVSAAGPGYFLTGDAAAILDPASSHGVLKAIMTGMMAGHLIAAVRNGQVAERAAAAKYAGWVAEWFRHDVRALSKLYAQLPGTSAAS